MEKLYTDELYAQMAQQATAEHKLLVKVQEEVEYEAVVYEFDTITVEEEVQKIDPETGEPMYDEEGNPIMETFTVEKKVPIMVDGEPYTEEVPIYDEEGNIIGYKEETVIPKVQKSHTETRTKIVEKLELQEDPNLFDRLFFETSLGFVKRDVTMLNNKHKDFLSDVALGLKEGIPVLTYDRELNQTVKLATAQFIKECEDQFKKDFYGHASNSN